MGDHNAQNISELPLSYFSQQTVVRHLDLDVRTWLRKTCKPRNTRNWLTDIVAHEFNLIKVHSDRLYPAIVTIDDAVWKFNEGEVKTEYEGRRSWEMITETFYRKETSWRDDFKKLFEYYFNRSQITRIEDLQLFRFPNDINFNWNCELKVNNLVLNCLEHYNRSFFQSIRHPFEAILVNEYQQEYADIESMNMAKKISIGENITSDVFPSLHKFNAINIEVKLEDVPVEDLVKFVKEIINEPRPIGFKFQFRGDYALFESTITNISRGEGWQIKKMEKPKGVYECISLEKNGMEVNIIQCDNDLLDSGLSVNFMKCGTARDKKPGLRFSSVHRIFRYLPFLARHSIVLETNIYNWPYPLKTVLKSLKFTCEDGEIVEAIADGSELEDIFYLKTLWCKRKLHVENLCFKGFFNPNLQRISAENITLESDEPIPKRFFDFFEFPDKPLKNLTATNKNTLKYGKKLIKRAQTITFTNIEPS